MKLIPADLDGDTPNYITEGDRNARDGRAVSAYLIAHWLMILGVFIYLRDYDSPAATVQLYNSRRSLNDFLQVSK
jgi:hypothetical protein